MSYAEILAQYYRDRNTITLMLFGFSVLCLLGVLAAQHAPARLRKFLEPTVLAIILLQFILSIVLGGGNL